MNNKTSRKDAGNDRNCDSAKGLSNYPEETLDKIHYKEIARKIRNIAKHRAFKSLIKGVRQKEKENENETKRIIYTQRLIKIEQSERRLNPRPCRR